MGTLDYFIDAKRIVPDVSAEQWDIFVSAYNDSGRVREVFECAKAHRKIWWVVPEYAYPASELPLRREVLVFADRSEADLVRKGFHWSGIVPGFQGRICIDITGFMRPHILFMLRYLKAIGIAAVEMIYTEPDHYARKADTVFSIDKIEVRQVKGFEGLHETDTSNDIVLLGVGYDHAIMAQTLLHKENARAVQIHSLPSLSADMYQESLLRLDQVSSVPTRPAADTVFFSSANDPFVTAEALADSVRTLNLRRPITNLYLAPLATKVQALGFGLYFLNELEMTAASIIYPYSQRYSRETSTGVGRTWLYPIHLS
jgi:hypothetical protein